MVFLFGIKLSVYVYTAAASFFVVLKIRYYTPDSGYDLFFMGVSRFRSDLCNTWYKRLTVLDISSNLILTDYVRYVFEYGLNSSNVRT